VFRFLNFRVELGDDFVDGKLPSLDINTWVRTIMYEFFQKTMASNLMVEANSALSKEVKMATLSEEEVMKYQPQAGSFQKAGDPGESMHQNKDQWTL
jgi:hypothetical protein